MMTKSSLIIRSRYFRDVQIVCMLQFCSIYLLFITLDLRSYRDLSDLYCIMRLHTFKSDFLADFTKLSGNMLQDFNLS